MKRTHLPTELSTSRQLAMLSLLLTLTQGVAANGKTALEEPSDGRAPEQTMAETASAGGVLEFEEKLDGKCYILSSGGKLVVMHNRDTARSVKYRLVRMFAGAPQMGRTVGTIEPGEGVKLGCSEVDGHYQEWVVERASFVQP